MKKIVLKIINLIPFFDVISKTRGMQSPVNPNFLLWQKILGINRSAYWPMHFSSVVTQAKNIVIGIDCAPGYCAGCYIQGKGGIQIGDYTQIAPNVAIISSNHSLLDIREDIKGAINIGKYCWLGFGCVILPNVTLGDYTMVRPNSVVDKSFPEGYCVIGGNPAKVIKQFPTEAKHLFTKYSYDKPFNGYIKNCNFEEYRKKHLNL